MINEQYMNTLWTIYEQEPPGSPFQFQCAIVAQIVLSSCSPIPLSFPLIRRFMNSLWTAYEQFMNKTLPAICSLVVASRMPVWLLAPGLDGGPAASCHARQPRLCWIMNRLWAVHEQFMNKVGLAFLAITWPESFGKWYLIICARTCLAEKHSWTSGTW